MSRPDPGSSIPPEVHYEGHPSATPLVEATAFGRSSPEEMEDIFAGRQPGHLYSRLSNPTLTSLERELSSLEGGIGAAVTSSGMAAITATILSLARAGDNVVASRQLFGGTYSLLGSVLSDYGIQTNFCCPYQPESFARALNENTRLVLVETISNPGLRVADLDELSSICADNYVPLVVDSTVTPPGLLNPGDHGASLTLHSTTKYLNGHGDAVGGCVIDNGNFDWQGNPHLEDNYDQYGDLAFLAEFNWRGIRTMGLNQSPADARSTLKGLETLSIRIKKHCENALELAQSLRDHGAVREIRYPGLKSHLDHELAHRQFEDQYGGIFTMKLKNKNKCFEFLNHIDLIKNMVNIGDTTSMAIHPASTICRDLDPGIKQEMGVTEDLIRICVGLEDYDDLYQDITEALNKP